MDKENNIDMDADAQKNIINNKVDSNLDNISNLINNSTEKEVIEAFRDFRKFLNEDENLLGKAEKFGIRFSRKYIKNILDNNIRLFYTNIKPINTEKTPIIANLCIIHGFGHYSQEFYEMACFLAKNGINCHLIDFRGHGYSGGCRFDWTIEDLQTDLLTLIKQAESDGVDLPIYIFAHSMGGGIVTSLFINNQYLQVNGIILSAPLLGPPMNSKMDKAKSFILSRVGNHMREFVISGNINPTELCKDENEIIRILNDKRILPLATPRTFRSIIKNCERILENCR